MKKPTAVVASLTTVTMATLSQTRMAITIGSGALVIPSTTSVTSFVHPSRSNKFILQRTTTKTTTSSSSRQSHLSQSPNVTATASPTPTAPRRTIHASHRILPLCERPADPSTLQCPATNDPRAYATQRARILAEWMRGKKSILCLTGAGMSTESGIPDYRGNRGSYFRGHKPIIHHEFMSSENVRKRYWARSLFGYSPFAEARPNEGHLALASLEENGWIGVECQVQLDDDDHDGAALASLSPWEAHFVRRRTNKEKRHTVSLSTITQNVDVLHSRAGSKHVLHLHGRGDVVKCVSCAHTLDRRNYHDILREWNRDWIVDVESKDGVGREDRRLRPDGDADWNGSYEELVLPPCGRCGASGYLASCNNLHANDELKNTNNNANRHSFYKTDVVFFGDSVPRHRVQLSNAAVDAADGLLCIGTSLAVHSAFRLAKRAIERGVPVAILNVGETRLERESKKDGKIAAQSLITKVESPIGVTLREVVNILERSGE